ncbi:MAG: hypothetical protein EOM88_01430 [Clostridia bacterium]|nr:hypothetical protein [Clostridia bacterium]
MLEIIAWILLIISLIVIITIILRRFPALAILNVDNIPGQKEAKFKDKILKQRVERDFFSISRRINKLKRKIGTAISQFFSLRYKKLQKLKTDLKKYKKLSYREKKARIENLFVKSLGHINDEDYEKAEASLIEIISLDPKNIKSFLKLAECYRLRKVYKEARETLEHGLKLTRQLKNDPELLEGLVIPEIIFSLAELCQEAELYPEALEYSLQAIDIEPMNPRYLDLILDLSIIKKDKKLALETWEKLSNTNPDNKKLNQLKDKIDLLIE